MKDVSVVLAEPVKRFVKDYSEALSISEEIFIENILIAFMAKLDVEMQVFGRAHQSLIMFAEMDDKILRGLELFDFLRRNYLKGPKLEQVLEDVDKIHEREQKRLEDMKRLKELMAEGVIPAGYRGPSSTALEWLEDLQENRITKEQFNERFESYKKHSGWGKEDENGD